MSAAPGAPALDVPDPVDPGPGVVPDVLADALEAELPAAVALRRTLHADPRLSGDEADSRDAVAAALGAALEPVAGTGGMLRLGPRGLPAVAVRAELDALPVTEATGLPYAATGAVAHVCGHDVHVAALVALCRAVARAGAATLPAPLLAVFQPREERSPSGAADVVVAPEFLAHEPGAMLGVHVQPELARGVVSARAGAVNASADEIDVVVTGRAGHGGYPHRTRDPVLALAAVVVALQQVVSRRTDPLRAAVVTIGQLDAGSAPNVVPATATARGTVRALDAARDEVLAVIGEVVEHTAAAHGCTAEVTLRPNEDAVVNDAALAAAAGTELRRRWALPDAAGDGAGDGAVGNGDGAAGEERVVDDTFRSCGADDFAHYGAVLPALMLFVGTGEAGAVPGSAPGLHHPAFSPDDDMVGEVARALLAAAVAAGTVLAPPDPDGPAPDGPAPTGAAPDGPAPATTQEPR